MFDVNCILINAPFTTVLETRAKQEPSAAQIIINVVMSFPSGTDEVTMFLFPEEATSKVFNPHC